MKEILYKHQNVENSLLKDYTICQKIGEGASSLVYRAFDTNTKNYYAIKAIPKEYLNSDQKLKELIKTQIYILKTCNNRNVLKCYEVLQSPDSIFIVTQLCDDSMENLLQTQKSFSQDQAVMYLRQILNGFKGLHDLGAMHRDFKLANVLLNKQTCKIGDFGYAKRMNKQDITFTVLGTKVTMAPEVIERKGYGFSADIWSLGVVFYQMLYGTYPYIGQNQFELLQKIKTQKIDYSSKRITPQAKDFIERCLTYKPQKRITWSQIYLHPLINRQSIQILYNIWNPKENLNENSKFYQKNQLQKQQQFEKETISGSIIMKDSHRKKLIMKQIQQVINKKIQKKERDGSNIMKFKKNQIEKEYVILRSAKLYIVYINKLCYPLKFLREQLIKRRIQKINSYKNEKQNQQKISRQHIYSNNQYLLPQYNSTKKKFEQSYQGNVQRGKSSSKLTTPKNSIKRATSFQQLISDNPKLNEGKKKVQVQSLIYLMYKKSYCELVQRYKMIKIKRNIFKITSHWEELCNSAYYKQIIGIISYQLEKIEKIVRIYEKKACWSNIQEISQFALKKEDNLGQIQRLCKKYLQQGAKYIFQYFKQAQVQKGRQYQNLIQFMEGLLYCLAPEDDDNKITPEQFHEKMSCPFNVMKAKVEILQRYEIYSKFNSYQQL